MMMNSKSCSGGVTEVTLYAGSKTLWLDFLPSPVNHLRATPSFCVVAMTDGSINVYSHAGRR